MSTAQLVLTFLSLDLKDSSNLKCSPAVPAGHNPKALNGLLSPQLEALKNSQTSLCEMLQEKEKKTWSGAVGMDHSALIPLRSKNFRERSDAHFVDVIKEDRSEWLEGAKGPVCKGIVVCNVLSHH